MKRKGGILHDPSNTKKVYAHKEKPSIYHNIQFKQLDTTVDTTLDRTGIWTSAMHLNYIIQGPNYSHRVGDKVILTKFNLRLYASLPSGVPPAAMRVLLVYDTSPNSSYPLITDILHDDLFTAHNNLANRDRFTVIADVIVEPIGFESLGTAVLHRRLDLKSVYGPGVSLQQQMYTGGLFLFFCQTPHLSDSVTLSYTARIRWLDA